MALTQTVREVLWLRSLFTGIGALVHAAEISKIYSNNKGAIALARNPGFHARSKHIDIRYDFRRSDIDQVTGTSDLQYCLMYLMTIDVPTKRLTRGCHQRHVMGMGLV